MNRRKHHKVGQLSPDLVEAVNKLLVDGVTYEDIAQWLKEKGHQVGKSSVGRYGKDFMSRLERMREIRDKARAIVADNADRPATEMAEAATDMAMAMIMETLTTMDDFQGQKVTELLKVLPKLADSSTRREALKLQFNKGVEAAARKIREELPKEIQAAPEIKVQIDALIEKIASQVVS